MKVQWYNNGKKEIQLTKEQTVPEGFIKDRIKRKLNTLIKSISKRDLFQYYMIENKPFEETFEHFNLKRWELHKLLKHYGITKSPRQRAKNNNYRRSEEQIKVVATKSSNTQKKKWQELSEEQKEAWRELQIKTHGTAEYKDRQRDVVGKAFEKMSEERKERVNQKRIHTLKKLWVEKKDELLKQRSDSEKGNRAESTRICRTKLEQNVYDSLILDYPDMQYNVRVNDLYPFFVDFYIPSKELFIEIQGHPSHGKIPYHEDDKESLKEVYKLTGEWLKIYTQRDVEKLNYAIKNNVNLIRIYPRAPKEKNYIINNNKNKDIIDKIFSVL